ncbi:MAG: hypothetical protein ACK5PP_06595 [Acidimicrobiales bacterium]
MTAGPTPHPGPRPVPPPVRPSRERSATPWARLALGLTLAVLTVTAAACGSDGDVSLPEVTDSDGSEVTLPDVTVPDVSLPDVTLPDVSLPDVTLPDVSAPTLPATTAAPDLADTSADDSGDLWTWLAVAAIVIGAGLWISSMVASRRADQQDEQAHRSSQRSRLDELVQNAYWATGQAMSLLGAAHPEQMADVPAQMQPYLTRTETEAARLSGEVKEPNLSTALNDLGVKLAALRGSLGSFVRDAGSDDQAQADASRQALDTNRHDVETAAAQVNQLAGSLLS